MKIRDFLCRIGLHDKVSITKEQNYFFEDVELTRTVDTPYLYCKHCYSVFETKYYDNCSDTFKLDEVKANIVQNKY